MKYIRTKNTIFEVENPNPKGIIFCKPKYTEMLVCVGNNKYEMKRIRCEKEIGKYHWKTEIIAQADTIEELCDYIFYKEFGKQKVFNFPEECNFAFIRDLLLHHCVEDVKFAILTDKGLIYVAKMNDKGELELL